MGVFFRCLSLILMTFSTFFKTFFKFFSSLLTMVSTFFRFFKKFVLLIALFDVLGVFSEVCLVSSLTFLYSFALLAFAFIPV